MKKNYLTLFLVFWGIANAQQPTINWQQVYGGSGGEISYAHTLTSDGGHVIAGGSSTDSNGELDFWIFKTDDQGTIVWEKKYGGTRNDTAFDLKQTTDGGYIVVGSTYSDDGDVVGFHGPLANSDVWVLKLDENGNLEWQQTLGGQSFDDGRGVIQTPDGGYIIAASAESTDGDPVDNYGYEDFWIVKLSSSGTMVWNNIYGGSRSDRAFTIEEANGGGFIIGGYSHSNDGDISSFHESPNEHPDGWVIKIDNEGILEWERCYGSSSYERIMSIKNTLDGGYIMAVEAGATDGDVNVPIQGETDAWLVKIDSEGAIEWQNAFGGTGIDYGTCVIQTEDSGYLLGINTFSTDGDASSSYGDVEVLIVKTSNLGELQWKKTVGGSEEDSVSFITQLQNGNYFITGGTGSSDGDITSPANGYDALVIELIPGNLSNNDFIINNPVSLYPNPCSDILNLKYDNSLSLTKVIISDIIGKVISQQSDNLNLINTSHLESGVYFISLVSNTALYKLKFIKN